MSNGMNVVAHNLQGMFSNRQLGIVSQKKEKSTEKLSSGFRINRAADDAAGLAISEKMRRQIRGLTQGTANAQDGVSMCQIADGALNEVSDMLHRITELSVKSANGTNTPEDRQAIQQEVNAILSEIDRVCDTTKFNEQPIFQGTEGVTIIPATYAPTTVGAFTASGTPAGSQVGTYTIAAGSGGFSINGESHGWSDFTDGAGHSLADSTISAGTYSFTHNGITMSLEVQDSASMDDVVGKLNGAGYRIKSEGGQQIRLSEMISVGGSPGAYIGCGYAENPIPRIRYDESSTSDAPKLVFYSGLTDINGEEIKGICDVKQHYLRRAQKEPSYPEFSTDIDIFETYIGTLPFVTGKEYPLGGGSYSDTSSIFTVGYSWDGVHYDDLNFTIKDLVSTINGIEYSLSDIEDEDPIYHSGIIYRHYINGIGDFCEINDRIYQFGGSLHLADYFSPDYKGRQLTPEERISAEGDKQVWIQSGAEAGDGMYLTFGRMDTNILDIHGLDVSTETGAADSIERSKEAVSKLNGIRSNIGAQQNRLEHTIKHQENTIENTQHAESLIRDTDMAAEMMNYSAANIIQQAGQSVLTQSNQSNQGVLSLLQ